MRDSGEMIYKMDRGKRHGQMEVFMRVSMSQGRNMGMGSTAGMMGHVMKESGVKTK